MDYVYLYGSSVRMGHKVYIIPILLGVWEFAWDHELVMYVSKMN